MVETEFRENLRYRPGLQRREAAPGHAAKHWQGNARLHDKRMGNGTDRVRQQLDGPQCRRANASGEWLVFVDADSHPSEALFADVAQAIQSGRCLAGGSTVKLEGHYPVASLITEGWNLLSRLKKWAAGSFIFCEAAAFREVGGFSHELYASEELELFQRLKRLAKQRRKRIAILHRHPLVTSARKMHLYTPGEHLRFLARTVLQAGKPLKSREECLTWYDGRR
jgi:hypothetical protein